MTAKTEVIGGPSTAEMMRSRSLGALTVRRLFRQRNAIVGMSILIFLTLVAIFAPAIAPYDPIQSLIDSEDVEARQKPCIHLLGCPLDQPEHIMGIDANFRDEYSRIIYGTRVSLFIGFSTIGLAVVFGAVIGAVSGYAGGWVDNAIMRIMDVVLAFPSFLLAIAIITVLGRGLQNALYAIAVVNVPVFARLVRASVLSIKEQEFVSASRALGANPVRLLFVRIFPNALPTLVVQATLSIGAAILEAAALSFLGLGAQPPTPEWGTMLGSERNQVFTAPHLVFFPGLAIMLTVLAFNLLGDGVRDAMDPRLAQVGKK
jgi:ABC-type dipeptide/oligopeptide/nickel transport system permease subunit